ncbi:nascent polypeptide-associated complex subunit alpha, muscle-specific form-like [Diaphorina citri]|uniref:Nascent polypeptide-associated complex subunit alpha, muscle-specific form-like n=1 Tax=Diaphorina citri TaxID=121845 RepID=A0A1S4EEI6_DIACI|nr:nascent polypeptide-associated complex subunit alpha, muscle-specific form-like [Diaphorina citri]
MLGKEGCNVKLLGGGGDSRKVGTTNGIVEISKCEPDKSSEVVKVDLNKNKCKIDHMNGYVPIETSLVNGSNDIAKNAKQRTQSLQKFRKIFHSKNAVSNVTSSHGANSLSKIDEICNKLTKTSKENHSLNIGKAIKAPLPGNEEVNPKGVDGYNKESIGNRNIDLNKFDSHVSSRDDANAKRVIDIIEPNKTAVFENDQLLEIKAKEINGNKNVETNSPVLEKEPRGNPAVERLNQDIRKDELKRELKEFEEESDNRPTEHVDTKVANAETVPSDLKKENEGDASNVDTAIDVKKEVEESDGHIEETAEGNVVDATVVKTDVKVYTLLCVSSKWWELSFTGCHSHSKVGELQVQVLAPPPPSPPLCGVAPPPPPSPAPPPIPSLPPMDTPTPVSQPYQATPYLPPGSQAPPTSYGSQAPPTSYAGSQPPTSYGSQVPPTSYPPSQTTPSYIPPSATQTPPTSYLPAVSSQPPYPSVTQTTPSYLGPQATPTSVAPSVQPPPGAPPPPTQPPTNPNPFSAESLFQTNHTDLLRRELDSRFLASSQDVHHHRGAPYSLRTEMHHHQHQHTHVHQHAPLMPPPPGAAALYPPTHLFKDIPKLGAGVDSPFYRHSLALSTYPPGFGLHPGLTPTPTATPFAPPNQYTSFTPKQLTEPPKPKPMKTGKWNAMHVRIAWEIYNHQQKAMAVESKGLKPSLPSASDLLRPPSHLLPSAAPRPPHPYDSPGGPAPPLPPHSAASVLASPFSSLNMFGRYGPSVPTFPPLSSFPSSPLTDPWARRKLRFFSSDQKTKKKKKKKKDPTASLSGVPGSMLSSKGDDDVMMQMSRGLLSPYLSRVPPVASATGRLGSGVGGVGAHLHPSSRGPYPPPPSPWDPYRYDPLRYNPLMAVAFQREEEERAKLFGAPFAPPAAHHMRSGPPGKVPSPASRLMSGPSPADIKKEETTPAGPGR